MISYHMRLTRMDIGMSREELEERSGVSCRTIQSYETGKSFPGILNLIALADALGVSIDDYIGHRIGG